MSGFDFGVTYEQADGVRYTSWGWGEEAAVAFVRSHNSRSWYPRPVEACRRPVGASEPVGGSA